MGDFGLKMSEFLNNLNVADVEACFEQVEERLSLILGTPQTTNENSNSSSKTSDEIEKIKLHKMNFNPDFLPNPVFSVKLTPNYENPEGYCNASKIPKIKTLKDLN